MLLHIGKVHHLPRPNVSAESSTTHPSRQQKKTFKKKTGEKEQAYFTSSVFLKHTFKRMFGRREVIQETALASSWIFETMYKKRCHGGKKTQKWSYSILFHHLIITTDMFKGPDLYPYLHWKSPRDRALVLRGQAAPIAPGEKSTLIGVCAIRPLL